MSNKERVPYNDVFITKEDAATIKELREEIQMEQEEYEQEWFDDPHDRIALLRSDIRRIVEPEKRINRIWEFRTSRVKLNKNNIHALTEAKKSRELTELEAQVLTEAADRQAWHEKQLANTNRLKNRRYTALKEELLNHDPKSLIGKDLKRRIRILTKGSLR